MRWLLAVAFSTVAAFPAAAQDQKARGAYLAKIMACGDCHTPGTMMGKPDTSRLLAGGDIGFEVPGLGIFYPPNLSPDRETGLGQWTDAQIIAAVRKGERPDGRQLAPVMPWPQYAALNDADARALAAYLKSLPPKKNAVPGPVGGGQKAPLPYLTVKVPQ